jgi:hypothetical protein
LLTYSKHITVKFGDAQADSQVAYYGWHPGAAGSKIDHEREITRSSIRFDRHHGVKTGNTKRAFYKNSSKRYLTLEYEKKVTLSGMLELWMSSYSGEDSKVLLQI